MLTPRGKLLEYAETGRLRDALDHARPAADSDVIDLIVDLCIRYCEPRRRRNTQS